MKQRHSKNQDKILKLLKTSKEAFSASHIHTKLSDINLATIYRNLDKLVSKDMITKLNIDGTTTLYEAKDTHQHAICNDCDKIIHFSTQDEKFKKILDIPDFEIKKIEIIVRGICNKK